MAELLYGIRKLDGRIVGISEIPKELKERKKKEWQCLCPSCGAELIPKKGDKKEHHFSHKTKECDISYARQTALHLMAKEIILNEKKIMTPPIEIPFEDLKICDVPEVILSKIPTYEFRKAKPMKCTKVYLEKRTSGFVPDITVRTEKGECLVEITVTNPTKNNEDKMKKIRELGLPVIEVDLKKYKDSEISRYELRKVLIESSEDKGFINYPRIEEYRIKAKEYYYEQDEVKSYINAKNKIEQKSNLEEEEEKIVFYSNDYANDIFYQNEKVIKDVKGTRWFLCKECGRVYPDGDIVSSGGKDSLNQGTCRECSNSKGR